MDQDLLAEALRGRRVLVVEDEAFVALDLEAMLTAAGVEVLGPAATLRHGLALAEADPLHAALLDINLGRDQSFSIAYRLQQRGVPFIFVTAYARYILPARLQGAPILGKPYRPAQVRQALAGLLLDADKSRALA
jgi:DNA-binding response OmpR family regulator